MLAIKHLLASILLSVSLLFVFTACSGSAGPETAPPPTAPVMPEPAIQTPPPAPKPAVVAAPKKKVIPLIKREARPAQNPAGPTPEDLIGNLNGLLGALTSAGTNANNTAEAPSGDDLTDLVSGFMSQLNIETDPDGKVKINGNDFDPAAALQQLTTPGGNPSAILEGIVKPETIEALRQQAAQFEPSPEQMDMLEKMTERFQGLREPPQAVTADDAFETGKILKRSYVFKEADNRNQEYALYVPKSYRKGKPAPLLVLLHGLGSSPQQVIRYQGLIAEAEKRGIIVVAPFGYNRRGWYGSLGQGNIVGFKLPANLTAQADLPDNLGELSEKDVLNVLDLMLEEFAVDRKRVYLMGHSMGGGGTLYLGMKYHQKWAALAPLAPAIYSKPEELAKIPNMPVIVVQGERDHLVPVNNTRRWVEAMKGLKMTHEYIEIKGGDHVGSIARNPKVMTRVFEFLERQTRP